MKVISSCLSKGCLSCPLLVDLCHHVANLLSIVFLLYTFFNISSTSLFVGTLMAAVVYLHIFEYLMYFVQISLWLVAVRLQINRMDGVKLCDICVYVYNTCDSCLAFSSTQNTWLDPRTLSVCLMCFWI